MRARSWHLSTRVLVLAQAIRSLRDHQSTRHPAHSAALEAQVPSARGSAAAEGTDGQARLLRRRLAGSVWPSLWRQQREELVASPLWYTAGESETTAQQNREGAERSHVVD